MKFVLFLVLLVLASCATRPKHLNHESILATNYVQTAAENRALYLQGYNIARLNFDLALKKKFKRPLAVVVDIDETVIDNSPYQAKIIQKDVAYPVHWKEWIDSAQGQPLPGSLEFLNYVVSKGAEVFYITNRRSHEYEATLANLKAVGLPVKDNDHLLVKSEHDNKMTNRAIVRKTHEIVLLLGDNLADFTELFEKKTVAERNSLVDQLKKEFGSKFIVFPNPIYGDWEGALYNYDQSLPPQQKHDLRMKALRGF